MSLLQRISVTRTRPEIDDISEPGGCVDRMDSSDEEPEPCGVTSESTEPCVVTSESTEPCILPDETEPPSVDPPSNQSKERDTTDAVLPTIRDARADICDSSDSSEPLILLGYPRLV